MFTEKFGKFVCDGETIACEVDGFKCVARTERDDIQERPDERTEGFWPSLDPKSAGYIGPKSKRTLRRQMAHAKAVMKAWENDEWDYCGVCVVIYKNDVQLTHDYNHTIWGIDRNYPKSDNSYLRDVANDLLPEALADAREVLAKLAEKETTA